MSGGRVNAILSLKGICKSFGAVVIAENLDLELPEGEALGMLGPNGAGKTTLFGIITGMLEPNAGQILFDGQDITRLSPAYRCRLGIARSFQIPQPFGGMTVFENLVVAGAFAKCQREREVYDLAAQILEDCGLGEKANVKADTLTLLDRKRLELARALATQPTLLLLDEVLAGLNPSEIRDMVPVIRAIRARGVGILMTEHVMQAVMSLSDHVFVLAEGRVIAQGPPEVVATDPQVIEAYLGKGAAKLGAA